MKPKKKTRKKPVKRLPPPEALSLMQKVKQKLEEMQAPVIALPESLHLSSREVEIIEYALMRGSVPEPEIDIFEYAFMDRTLSIMEVAPQLRSH